MPTSRLCLLLVTSAALAAAPPARADEPAPPAPPPSAPIPERILPPSAEGPGVDPDLPELLGRLIGIAPAKHPAPRRFHVAPLPYVLLNPLLGAGGGLALVGGFRLGSAQDTAFSHFEASGFATTNHQLGLLVRSEIRFPRNAWILATDWGGGRFPNPAWGVGGHTRSADRTIVRREQLQLHETFYRRIFAHLYGGLGSFVDDFVDVVDERRAAGEATRFSQYAFGTGRRSFSSGLTLNLLWDGRDSTVAPTRGSYLLGRFRFEPSLLGSDDDWSSFYLDGRTYFAIPGRRDVLGLWAFAWSSSRGTPYLLLPQVGGDPEHRSGRGMVEGRYAALDLLYGEVEYRAHLWKALGAVAALHVTAPSERGAGGGAWSFETLHPGAAVGLRVLLDRTSGSNVCLDAAWAPRGHLGFYLNANETF
jgi:hypothetical protein